MLDAPAVTADSPRGRQGGPMVRTSLLAIFILTGCTPADDTPRAAAQQTPDAPGVDTAPFSLASETWAPQPIATDRDADHAPFSPGTPPDHVITLETVGESRRERTTIRRHGAWARVETTGRDGTTTHYVGFDTPVSISLSRLPDGRYAYASLVLAQPYGGGDRPPVQKTGERDVVLGEACEVWDVTGRTMSSYSELRRLGCITPDGIEMWSRYVGARGYVSEMRAVSLERRPVPAAEAAPPGDLLDPEKWPLDWPVPGRGVDIWLTNGEPRPQYRKETRYRRLGDLERVDTRTTIHFTDRTTQAVVWFERDREGRFVRLEIRGPNRGRSEPVPQQEPPVEFDGERCRWLHMTPGMHDYSRSACLTGDGSLLAERIQGRGGRTEMTPQRVRRGRLAPADVGPPPPLIDPANWGLPARRAR